MTGGDADFIESTAVGRRRPALATEFVRISAALGVAFAAVLGLIAGPVPALAEQAEAQTESLLPLPDAGPSQDAGAAEGAEAESPEVGRLGDAMEQMKQENPVVARVNGYEIRWAAVLDSAEDLPDRYREQLESVFPALLDRLVDMRLLADEARGQGLQNEEVLRAQLIDYEDRLLSNALLDRYLADRVTTAALRQRYDALVSLRRANLEVRARHIHVESEMEAGAMIAKLNDGADFAELAKEHSIGASAERGGDLGYFYSTRMAPEFAAALNELEPGSYTEQPVETEFGWHVILLVDRRDDDIPSFIDMQDKLRDELTKEMIGQLVGGLRRRASLEMFPEDAAPGGVEVKDSLQ